MTITSRVNAWLYFSVREPVVSSAWNLAYWYSHRHAWGNMGRAKAQIEDTMRRDYAHPIPEANSPLAYAVANAFLGFTYLRDRVDARQWVRTSIFRGCGDCEDFATLGKWALNTLGIPARLVRLVRTDGNGTHTVAVSNDLHWVVRGTRTIDLWEYAENNRETDMREALLAFMGAEYYETYGTGWK
ncbi:MAG: hypothetical protein BWY06_02786 [Candidatus Latescibacteria bacterium ADurb.Bin168]|nr:MAG: hypothetical protein BWY06_02786 [Candidatus Latescibacteria bacterium ADurb.Bin168]